MMDIASIAIIATFVVGGNSIVGVIVWGLKAQMRADLAEQKNDIIKGINGTYVRADVCAARHEKDEA